VVARPVRPPISLLRRRLGYLVGFPWPLVPVTLLTLARAVITGDDRGRANATALLQMMLRGADLFTSLIWLLRGFYSISDPYKPARYFEVQDHRTKTVPHAIELDGLRLQYGVGDFDAPERRMTPVYRALYWVMRNGPRMQRDHLPLPPVAEFQKMLADTFGPTFVAYRPFECDPDDPRVPVRYVTHDFGAPWLAREGDRFVADLSHWEPMPLKCGGRSYEPYGGRLEFDAAMTDVSITWDGARHRPGDPGWPKARFVFVSTALISVVLEHHTLQVHFLNAALFALKTRTHLGCDHPIARLLRPFTFRTVMINEHAIHSILGDSGILNHGTALTWPAIKRLYHHAASAYRHLPLPEQLRAKGLLEPDGTAAPGVAFAEEGLLVYQIIDRFVRSYVGLYYAGDDSIRSDEALCSFYAEIRGGLPQTAGIAEAPTVGSVVDLLAVFVWNVTFWHDATSQTGNSLADYRLGGVLIKRDDVYGTFYPNIQEHLVTLLAHQLTTVEGNKVLDNFHKFWLDDRALGLALQFQRELWQYRGELAGRNATRDMVFNAYDPTVTESSVQT
jgi:hypothetical protein